MTTPTISDFVGLVDTIYNRTDLTQGSFLQINNTRYEVLDVINNSSSDGFYGVVLRDRDTNAVFVVDRGTDQKNWQDFATDFVMAGTDDNLQWQDANTLAQFASQYATTNGSIVYTVGHSLGGTLAQMQAAIYGWNGVTFNAYGSGEVLSGLGYAVDPYQPNITNYRTLFDLVSNSSTQIGTVITLEDSRDSALLASGNPLGSPVDLVEAIGLDHSISNFYENSDPAGSSHEGVPTYTAAGMFSHLVPTESENMAQLVVYGLGQDLATTREITAELYNTTNQVAVSQAVLGWITGNYKSGETVVIPADSYLLENALNPSSAYNVYRAALDADSPVVLDGIDPSEVQNDTLWSPGQTSGSGRGLDSSDGMSCLGERNLCGIHQTRLLCAALRLSLE